jgi:hypothetical protein
MSVTSGSRRPYRAQLSPVLDGALSKILDPRLSHKLREVCVAGATAIERLSTIDLVKYEPTSVEGGTADLALWEEMAPVVRDALVAANRLMAAMRGQFPDIVDPAPTPEKLWESWAGATTVEARLEIEVETVMRVTHNSLAEGARVLGERMRSPSVVSDRWNLLSILQTYRADFRREIGDLVFLVASGCTEVRREDVVPGHTADVAAMSKLRRTVADLLRSMVAKMAKFSGQPSPDLCKAAGRMEEDLRSFILMPASRAMLTEDKRMVALTRASLREAAGQADLQEAQLMAHLSPLLELLERVARRCTDEVLGVHDRRIISTCGARLAEAELHRAKGSPGARRSLTQAIEAAEELYGLDEALDAFIRDSRLHPVQEASEAELEKALADFRERLAGLPAV